MNVGLANGRSMRKYLQINNVRAECEQRVGRISDSVNPPVRRWAVPPDPERLMNEIGAESSLGE